MSYWVKIYILLFWWNLVSIATQASTPPNQTLEFIQNRGQWKPNVQFMAPLATGRLYVEATGFTYALYAPQTKPAHTNIPATPGSRLRCHAYSIKFAGSHPMVPVAEEALTTTYNYFLGADPT